MGLSVGANKIKKVFVGENKIKGVYVGSNKVWSSGGYSVIIISKYISSQWQRQVYVSEDYGVTATYAFTLPIGANIFDQAITYCNGYFFVLLQLSNTVQLYRWQKDTATTTLVYTSGTGDIPRGIISAEGYVVFMTVNSGGYMKTYSSTDMTNFVGVGGVTGQFAYLDYANGYIFAMGSNRLLYARHITSSTFSKATFNYTTMYSITSVTYLNGYYIVAGDGTTARCTTPTGQYTIGTYLHGGGACSFAYGKGKLVMYNHLVSSGGFRLYYSVDNGASWTQCHYNSTQYHMRIYFDGERFYALGITKNTTQCINGYSDDGVTWTFYNSPVSDIDDSYLLIE